MAKIYRKIVQKVLNDPENHEHSPRARYLESEVKQVLGSITVNKASGSDGIPAELFQILEAVKVLHSICQQIWK